jgi:REP element-mobilizing transposase RayT
MPRSLATRDGCRHRVEARFQRASDGGIPAASLPGKRLNFRWQFPAPFLKTVAGMKLGHPKPDPRRLVSGFHFRGQLPHLKREGAAYFITFRLADSLPREVVEKLKREREAIVQQAMAAKRPLTWREEQELFAWYSERVEAFLDAGAGECWLRRTEIADLVAGALNFFSGERYDLQAWVVMPNHVHVVLWPWPGHALSEIEHSWKSYTASQANKLLDRVGERFWQKESYDHTIRDDDERVRLCAYIENNPVKAGLCARPEDWTWSSAHPEAGRFQRRRASR